ncbi:protein of unknown function [Ruminococcaceae bacterium BL-6]|nr:protein of unknown function [Ruminococcaceae bacterium BL-6]CAB1247984.1 protein of unknown function [Ruminococcaceae bacterium BL-6]
MEGATLIGYKEITSKKGVFTIAYLVFTPDEGLGQACKDVFLTGHPLTEEMIGQAVRVSINLENGRVTAIHAA